MAIQPGEYPQFFGMLGLDRENAHAVVDELVCQVVRKNDLPSVDLIVNSQTVAVDT
ncbi:hypothetical protein [Salininema proteolyticum]|uniref:Uncharacterized protein n=1 Tax=Salininema proteolyticum TaxID=1607685 RepID=A0ABV8TTW0_9ACTN